MPRVILAPACRVNREHGGERDEPRVAGGIGDGDAPPSAAGRRRDLGTEHGEHDFLARQVRHQCREAGRRARRVEQHDGGKRRRERGEVGSPARLVGCPERSGHAQRRDECRQDGTDDTEGEHRAGAGVVPAHSTTSSTLAVEDLIAELKENYTIVIVTHNMQQAARCSDRTGFFNIEGTGKPGQLVEFDDTQKIFNNPTEKATEDYISGRFG